MGTPSTELDAIMEDASGALSRMEYLVCEARCLEALAVARQQSDWAYYARILLPLQEARRQRRMIAAEGVVRLGSAGLEGQPTDWLDTVAPGCIVLTQPHTAATARELATTVRTKRLCAEVLLADNPVTAPRWTLRAYNGPSVNCEVAAPAADWLDRWLVPDDGDAVEPAATDTPSGSGGAGPAAAEGARPVDWFLDACEALGDAALAQVSSPLGDPKRIEELERCLDVVTDHEIVHQALGDAARALFHTGSGG